MANFLNNDEKKISKEFLDRGYVIKKISNKKNNPYPYINLTSFIVF